MLFKNQLFIAIALLFTILSGCKHSPSTSSSSSASIKISSEQDIKFEIITYAGFKSNIFLKGEIKADEAREIKLDYDGFALLTINGIYPYPLIIGKGEINIGFSKTGVAPEITNSPENTFFYDFYGNHNKLSSQVRFYSESLQKAGEQDPPFLSLQTKLDSVISLKMEMAKQLPKAEFPVASAILQEKLLEESSWGIKTLNELHKTQKEFTDFAKENYKYLKNSEQLSALIRQSFMMLEYINYYESIEKSGDQKADITKAKELLRSEMLKQTQMWMDALKADVPEPVSLAQCVKTYYNRGMVSKSLEIISAFDEKAKCEGGGVKQINFPASFEITKGDGVSSYQTDQIQSKKIIVLVDNDCIFSKIAAVRTGRQLEKSPTPLILIPKGNLDGEILALDKLCVKDLYFAKKGDWVSTDLLDQHKYPYFILLDGSNKVIKATDNWNELKNAF